VLVDRSFQRHGLCFSKCALGCIFGLLYCSDLAFLFFFCPFLFCPLGHSEKEEIVKGKSQRTRAERNACVNKKEFKVRKELKGKEKGAKSKEQKVEKRQRRYSNSPEKSIVRCFLIRHFLFSSEAQIPSIEDFLPSQHSQKTHFDEGEGQVKASYLFFRNYSEEKAKN